MLAYSRLDTTAMSAERGTDESHDPQQTLTNRGPWRQQWCENKGEIMQVVGTTSKAGKVGPWQTRGPCYGTCNAHAQAGLCDAGTTHPRSSSRRVTLAGRTFGQRDACKASTRLQGAETG